jgi:hypothetical protein
MTASVAGACTKPDGEVVLETRALISEIVEK